MAEGLNYFRLNKNHCLRRPTRGLMPRDLIILHKQTHANYTPVWSSSFLCMLIKCENMSETPCQVLVFKNRVKVWNRSPKQKVGSKYLLGPSPPFSLKWKQLGVNLGGRFTQRRRGIKHGPTWLFTLPSRPLFFSQYGWPSVSLTHREAMIFARLSEHPGKQYFTC